MQQTDNHRRGIFLALVTAVCLGSITTQAKLFYTEGGNAMTLMLTRFFFSTLVFGVILLIRRQSFQVIQGNRGGVFAVGSVWSAAMIFYLLSVETISVSAAVLILYFYPILVLIFAIFKGQLPPSLRIISLFLLAFCGLYMALSGEELSLEINGLVFAILACFGAAFTFVKGASVAPMLSPLVMTFWVNFIGLLMILPLVYTSFSLVTSSQGISALAIATAFYIVAILSQFQALARLPASTAALILNLEPVVSILLAVFILNEQLGYIQWLGVVVVISVLTLSLRPRKPAQNPVEST